MVRNYIRYLSFIIWCVITTQNKALTLHASALEALGQISCSFFVRYLDITVLKAMNDIVNTAPQIIQLNM